MNFIDKVYAKAKSLKWEYNNLGNKKTDSGTLINISSFMDHLVYKEIFIDKLYDQYLHYWKNEILKCDQETKVIDIGANIGFFSIRVCDFITNSKDNISCHIVAVEPSNYCVSRLKKNIAQIRNRKIKFSIFNHLVGALDGYGTFIEDPNHHIGQRVINDESHGKGRDLCRLPYKDISSILTEKDNISLLKCDIEGDEIKFLINYRYKLSSIPLVLIEFHGKENINKGHELMIEYGFQELISKEDKPLPEDFYLSGYLNNRL